MRDVREFEGHIACDGDTRSEIVVPVMVGEKVGIRSAPCSSKLMSVVGGSSSRLLISIAKLKGALMRWMSTA